MNAYGPKLKGCVGKWIEGMKIAHFLFLNYLSILSHLFCSQQKQHICYSVEKGVGQSWWRARPPVPE